MYEGIRYHKPFLKQVIARLDFVAPIPGLEKTLPPKFGKALSELFPIAEPRQGLEHQLQIRIAAGGHGLPTHEEKSFMLWNFYGLERERQLSIAPQFMFVTYSAYSTYENIRDVFQQVVNALDGTYPDLKISRFGLRYINNIELDGVGPVVGWNEYISPELLGTIPFFDAARLTRLVQIVELKCETLDLRFQFGMPNPDFPAPIKRPSFVLDFDAYCQAAHEPSASLALMDKAHDCIQGLFEKSITDTLRGKMNAIQAAVPQ